MLSDRALELEGRIGEHSVDTSGRFHRQEILINSLVENGNVAHDELTVIQ